MESFVVQHQTGSGLRSQAVDTNMTISTLMIESETGFLIRLNSMILWELILKKT